jgi:hypothetical protein
MLLVLLLTSTALGLTTVAYRSTDDAIRVEDFQRERDFRDQVITDALAGGVQLLRLGEPLVLPFRYVVPTVIADGSTFYTLVEIEENPKAKGGSADPYIVTARQGTLADSLKWGLPPLELLDDAKKCKKEKKKKEKSNNGVGWGVGGVPPGADQGNKNDKDNKDNKDDKDE